MIRVLQLSIFLTAMIPMCCIAQQNGAVLVRIPNGPTPQCINYNTDQVWLTLYRVVTTKKNGWFTSQNQAEIIINVQVKTQPQSDKPLAFPLSNKVNIQNYGTGQISIPVEYTLVSGLVLKQGTAASPLYYTSFGVDTTLVNLEGKRGVGVALDALNQIVGSKKLPIPDNPYSQAAGYLLDFANTAVSNSIASQNGQDKYATASLALNFDPTGSCSGGAPDGQGFETTGTKAILMSDGVQGAGYVPIDQTNNYCWSADTTPSFILKAAPKSGVTPCSDASYSSKYLTVTNNFIAYFLQKRQVSGHLGSSNAARDKKDSQKLCDVLGLENSCPAAK